MRRNLFLRYFICLCVSVVSANVCNAQETSHSPGWVVISVDQYRDLRSRAYPSENPPERPSVAATLTRVDYDVQVSGEAATGQANLTVDVLKDGWVRIPIPAGLLVREAKFEGKLLPLVVGSGSKHGGQLNALLSHSGRSVLTLSIAVPVTSAAASESLSLPATESGITRASVQLSRPEVDVTLTGGLLTEKSEQSRESKWTAYGEGTEPLTFAWRRKAEDHRSTLPLRRRGSLRELVSLGEDSTSISAEVDLQVLQGSTQQATIQLGDKININSVSGAGVADWEVTGNELTVKFLEPVEKGTRFVVNCETTLPRDGDIAVPIFHVLNTERETGGIAVEVLGAGEIKDAKFHGLEEADASDLGGMIATKQSPSMAAYRFREINSAVRDLSVNVARYTQQAVLLANVEEARYRALFSADGKSMVQARYAVRNNDRNFLKVTLPAGATIWSAALAGKAIRPGQALDGSLLLPLEKSRGAEDAPEFAVELVYFIRGAKFEDKGEVNIPLPTLDLPVSRTGLLIYYPPMLKVSAKPGMFHEETYAAPVSASLNATPPVPMSAAMLDQTVEENEVGGAMNSRDKDRKTRNDTFFAKSQGARAKGILPIKVEFPAFGPSVFFVGELTSAGQAPSLALSYQQEKKGGKL